MLPEEALAEYLSGQLRAIVERVFLPAAQVRLPVKLRSAIASQLARERPPALRIAM
jgi:hypothetical protein